MTAGALLLVHELALAGGYKGWQFGMSPAQVMAVGDPSRYYTFRNGDVGAGKVPFGDGDALLSFYFVDKRMEQVMLVAYFGKDAALARTAWANAYQHLTAACGEVESPTAGPGAKTLEAVLAACDKGVETLDTSTLHQMGCLHMPASEHVWASARRLPDGQLMLTVRYAKP